MTSKNTTAARINSGPGRMLVAVYGLLGLAASGQVAVLAHAGEEIVVLHVFTTPFGILADRPGQVENPTSRCAGQCRAPRRLARTLLSGHG